jgi:alpha-galactosidase
MLEVGNGMTPSEDRAHFAMWSMVASPLIAGNDFRKMSKETLSILTNKDIIAVNQDKLGIQGFRYSSEDGIETWVKPLSDGNCAVTFLNRNETAKKINFDWKAHKIVDEINKLEADFAKNQYSLKNLWTGKEAGNTKKTFTAEIPSHDVVTLKLTKK